MILLRVKVIFLDHHGRSMYLWHTQIVVVFGNDHKERISFRLMSVKTHIFKRHAKILYP